ncbi:mandelate racemase/muconate lactonizing enzyme family protein [Paenibacillaceae bacterium WGS1546]|uniref:mandelate racemase/muconate lactonizing enzyme family protein n=1 Tax=Cohnella sp. WGS1546 TaxID=3366810 RepID=UPI00372D40B5
MKITEVETILLSYKYKEDEVWTCPGWTSLQRNAMLVRIWTDKGLYGIGEIGEATSIPLGVEKIVEERFKPMLIGQDPGQIEYLWKKMYVRTQHWGTSSLAVAIISGLETALWDLLGKKLDQPVYELLGGRVRDRIRVYASAGMSKTNEDLAREVAHYKELGYSAVKMRIGNPDYKADVEAVRMAREAIGYEIDLMADAGMCYVDNAWDFNTVLKAVRELEPSKLYWLEEPFVANNMDDYVRLTSMTDIPIAAGEHFYTKYEFKDWIARRAVDIVQPDVTRSGGILECKKIAAVAEAYHMRCAPHIFTSGVSLMANFHFMMSTPNIQIMEYDRTPNPLRDELLIEPLEYEDGHVRLPRRLPGLGIDVTDDVRRKFAFIPDEPNRKPEYVCL